MKPRSGAMFAIATVTLGGVLVGPSLAQDEDAQASSPCGGTQPCFAKVDDILGGQRHLLANDDLVVSIALQSGDNSTYKNLPLYTDLLKPGLQPEQTVDETDCSRPPPGPAPLATRLGRIYNQKEDVIVTSVWTKPPPTDSCSQTFFVMQPDGTVLHEVGNAISPEARMALLDADLDGFDDVFMINDANMTFHSPADVNDTGSDMVFRSVLAFPSDAFTPRGEPVTGDFNSDGAVDIAWLGAAAGGDVQVHFASVCPAAGWAVLDTTCSQAFEIVLSGATIDTGQTWTAASGDVDIEHGEKHFEDTFPRMGLAADDFWGNPDAETGGADDELVLIQMTLGKGDAYALAYDFSTGDGTGLEPIPANPAGTLLPKSDEFPVAIDFFYPVGNPPFVTSGRLDWGARNEQVVAAWSAFPHFGIWVLSFDEDPTGGVSITVADTVELDEHTNIRIRGVAVGRFDPPEIASTPPLQPLDPDTPQPLDPLELDFNQQIAVLYTEESASDGSDPRTLIDIYTVDPTASAPFTPTQVESARTVFLDEIPFRNDLPVAAPLQAGDLQGRSLRLGAPVKTTIIHTQADTVLGMPPMHIDYITPPEGSSPEIYNVSAFPDNSHTAYTLTSTSSGEASRQSTTSYTYATKESAEEKVSYGVPDIASVSVDAKQSASQKHSHTVGSTYGSYESTTFSMSTTTQFDDSVSATSSRMNIYSYPVIGHFACPADCDCSATGPLQCLDVPLHVQFSGPDNVTPSQPLPAAALEWYQPLHEPGNVFSYPGNLAQLQADLPQPAAGSTETTRFQELSSGGGLWDSAENNSVALTWDSRQTGGTTAGSVSNHSFDASVSVSGGVTIGGFGASASGSFDYNKSKSVSTLNTKTVSLDESDGVTMTISSQSSDSALYAGETYIFGLTPPSGTVQSIEQQTDIKANGVLTVASTAELSSTEITPSPWWYEPKAYGGHPDVALNHPSRWADNSGAVSFNCPVQSASPAGSGCPNESNPSVSDYSNAGFYVMKGLFVTPGDEVSGPPTTRTMISGEPFTLRARIYNYSLTDMPDGTEVHVAFYAQPANQHSGFLAQSGNPDAFVPAVYIDEDILDPIPPFCGDSCEDGDATRNWAFAQVALDTTVLGQPADGISYWNFWVVTWMQDENGLVEEIPGHGLTAIPGAGLTSFADVEIEAYSNNVGVYGQVFALQPASDGEADSALLASAAEQPELAIEKLGVKPQRRLRGETPSAQATLRTSVALDDVMVRFYAGDPVADGVMFDVEMIPHIPAGQPYVVAVPYQPRVCDARRLYVEAIPLDGPVGPADAQSRRRIRPDLSCHKARDHGHHKHFGKREHRQRDRRVAAER